MGRTRVLVVDDDPMNLSVLDRVLKKVHIDTTPAENGEEALALLKAQPEAFDVLLLDLVMPRMNGIQLLRRVKADPRLKDIPVILQTASNAPEQVAEGLQAGAYYYLTKPITQRLLQAVVRTAAEAHALHRSLARKTEREASPLALLQGGDFACRTLSDCLALSQDLARLCPDPARTVTGLSELLINALEHGNLGITYEDKTDLLEGNRWKAEVQRRLQLPENLHKRVRVKVHRSPERIRFEIQDDGPGFDWQSFLVACPSRIFDNHGRGIFMARVDSFDHLEYCGSGNHVVAEIHLS